MSKDIFIVLKDTASEYKSHVSILKVTTNFNDALATYKENVEKARELAQEMNYEISESAEDLVFISDDPEDPASNHYNISLIRWQLSDENGKDTGTKLSDSLETLKSITTSGYWPYSSPAPCYTEVIIRQNLNASIHYLERALAFHKEMFGKTKRNPMACTKK